MNAKEKLKVLINIHTRVVTGIFFFLCFYLFWLPGDSAIRIKDILGVQIIGLISAVAYLPFLVSREYSKIVMGVLRVVYFLLINATVYVMGLWLHWFSVKVTGSIVAIELMIVAVYVITTIIFFTIDYSDAAKLNKKLQERNNSVNN